MLIPVRCFSCNKVIANKYNIYKLLTQDNEYIPDEAFKKINVNRYCCKRMLLSHKDFIDKLLEHEQDYDYVKIY